MSSSGSGDELDLSVSASEDSKSENEDESQSAGSELESENEEEDNAEGGDKDDEEAGEEEDEEIEEAGDEGIEEAGDEGIEESGDEEETEEPGLSETESSLELENNSENDDETLLMSENETMGEKGAAVAPKKVLKSSGIVNTMIVERKGTHPAAAVMVTEAITTLNGKGGTSLQAIKKYMVDVYQVDMNRYAPLIRKFLKIAVEKGTLVQTKGRGASGSFKVAPPKSKRAAKNPVVPAVQAEGEKRKPKAESQPVSRKVTKKAVNTVSSPTLKTKKPAVRLPTVPVSARARKPTTAAMAVEPAPPKRKAKTSNVAKVVPAKKVKPSTSTTDQPKTKTAKTSTAIADPPKKTLKNPPAKSKNIAPPQSPVKPKSPAKASKKGMKLPVDKAMKPAAKKLPK